ncbi:hypothetical protein GA0115253_100553 [Streptomyces sp. Termitarium-T10T-6]|nr:hypothetical protein GA0115253_100553 [Streptomyces sp. Termitarium-T10T-6]
MPERRRIRSLPDTLSTLRTPANPGFWRSPVRGARFTAVLGVVLLAGLTLLFVTGLLSYAAYNPDLNRVNDKTPDKGLLGFYLFSWPTGPHWLYRLTQGLHVTVGIVLVPVLLAKLWSVIPRLFALPPARSVGHALERISLVLLIGGALFQFLTGLLNIQLDYIFPGSFYPLHFYGAWVFLAGFVTHTALKAPQAIRVLRNGVPRGEADTLAAPDPLPATLSRRGALAMVGAGSLLLLITSAGRSFDGPLRRIALLTPRGGTDPGPGPNAFQINKTAAAVRITPADTGENWRLTVRGPPGSSVSPGPNCWPWNSTQRRSRSPVWRAGRPRTSSGAGCGSPIWRRSPDSRTGRRASSSSRSSAAAPSARPRCATTRSVTAARCSRWR